MMRPWIGNGGLFNCLVAIKSPEVLHFWSPTEKIVSLYMEKEYDLYFAMASFDKKLRRVAHAVSASSFWLDVDYKDYGDIKDRHLEAHRAMIKFLSESGLPQANWIIHSGNGLHMYWLLDRAIPKLEWQPAAKALQRLCLDKGFKVDPSRTCDMASILRVPGTKNFKDPRFIKEVKVVREDPIIPASEFLRALPTVSLPSTIDSPVPFNAEDLSDEWNIYPPADAQAIAAGCLQMNDFREKKGALSEPLWRAGLSVLVRCINGEKLIHEWSKGDPRYDAQETLNKAKLTKGPSGCEQFAMHNPELCNGCPWKGKLTGPILLGVPRNEKPPDIKNGPKIGMLNDYSITKQGIYLTSEDPTKVRRLSRVCLWVDEVRERAREEGETNRTSLLIRWKNPGGEDRSAVLYASDLYDLRAFVSWLANENLMPLINHGHPQLLLPYFTQYMGKIIDAKEVKMYHERLGWYKNEFILGNVAATASGVKKTLMQSTSPIAKLGTPSKNLDAWKVAISVLKNPNLWPHAFTLMAGFGSPFLNWKNWNSAVISLAGPSGVGKTLAAKAALSIYGKTEHLAQASSATINSIEGQLSRQKDVPYLLDEVSIVAGNKLANFIYMAANGEGKAAMTQSREFREVGYWSLIPFITSNHPLLDMAPQEIEEAHRRRLLEIYIGNEVGLSEDEGLKLAQVLRYGGAPAPAYISHIIKNRETLEKRLDDAYFHLQGKLTRLSAERFILWTLASAWVGGEVASDLGLVPFTPDEVIRQVLASQKDNEMQFESEEEICRQGVAEFLNSQAPHSVYWPASEVMAKSLVPPMKEITVRAFSENIVAIHANKLKERMRELRVSMKVFYKIIMPAVVDTSLGNKGTSVYSKVVTLTAGSSPVRCYYLNLKALGLSVDSIKPGFLQEQERAKAEVAKKVN